MKTPWTVEHVFCVDRQMHVQEIQNAAGDCVAVLRAETTPGEVDPRTASLLAAAPDLLAALNDLVDFAETLAADGGRSADLRAAYTALDKATGGGK